MKQLVWALSSLGALAACDTFPLTTTEFDAALARESYVQQSAADAWVATEGTELVLEKALGPVREQRILLQNRTFLRGENVIVLRTRGEELSTIGRFRPLDLLPPDGTPYPFDPFEDLSFRTEEDALGMMNWAVWTNQAGLTCILAFRRLDAASRTVPHGAAVMDMMVRNCINGTAEEALLPARPDISGYSATGSGPDGAPQMLSPLAGPLP
ncbi:hypothetical protein [Roseivivax sediminis]|uniref:Lipoprotein n=1 Tax=Roseivivax sediminis TaxID=936889 RepID=A0A1I1VND8_9RHOB|nr:hypothetical protein [Roseivivax sediminis]SFD84329.1 hypothetical protein SAMN04515678_103304 [Roseivivax sediminis]